MPENRSVADWRTGLVGASALASGSCAYAAVMPTATLPADLSTPAAGSTASSGWDIDADGINDFAFAVSNDDGPFFSTTWAATVFGYGASSPFAGTGLNGVAGYTGEFFPGYADRLAVGVDVGPQSFVAGAGPYGQVLLGSMYDVSLLGEVAYGQFVSPFGLVVQGYLGLRFSNASGAHNAWIEIRVTRYAGIEFLNAAWSSDPASMGGDIETGEVPGPGTLAAIALGAAAFSRRGRERPARGDGLT